MLAGLRIKLHSKGLVKATCCARNKVVHACAVCVVISHLSYKAFSADSPAVLAGHSSRHKTLERVQGSSVYYQMREAPKPSSSRYSSAFQQLLVASQVAALLTSCCRDRQGLAGWSVVTPGPVCDVADALCCCYRLHCHCGATSASQLHASLLDLAPRLLAGGGVASRLLS